MKDMIRINSFYFDKNIQKILRDGSRYIREWINLNIEFYNKLCVTCQPHVEDACIAAFFSEIMDTADGISILYQDRCVNAAFPLVRKLYELYLQIAYMLYDDSAEKAIAYTAYYISKKKKGGNDKTDIYTKLPSYGKYKEKADLAYTKKKYYEWYDIYEKVKSNSDKNKVGFEKMSGMIDKREEYIYLLVYGQLCRKSHGGLSRDNIMVDYNKKLNYIREYRYPGAFMNQLTICAHSMQFMNMYMEKHYSVSFSDITKRINEQKKMMDKIKARWNDYEKNSKSLLS